MSDAESGLGDILSHQLANLVAAAQNGAEDEVKLRLATEMVEHAMQLNGATPQQWAHLFAACEAFGTHVMPVTWFSPIPALSQIDPAIYQRRYDDVPGLGIDFAEQAELAMVLAGYAVELADLPEFPAEPSPDNAIPTEPGFTWRNPMFPPIDALAYYGMVRHLRPQRVLEVGSGYSTAIAARALARNGHGTLVCIEPYPSALLEHLASTGQATLVNVTAQQAPMAMFEELEAGDILFIDSTHVAKAGSDVVHHIFQVLPRLRPGVWCHVHDIFHPFDYPRSWIEETKVFWNEQYLLLAFLAYNTSFRIRLSTNHLIQDQLESAASIVSPVNQPALGGGLWFERV